jgi:cyclophilin family peptidyl-prolyl cis-trans isomerase
MIGHRFLPTIALLVVAARSGGQPQSTRPTRIAILEAEDRRAPTARDLAIIRAALNSPDEETQRIALRALGRLERPQLISDIVPELKADLPEIRAEAANAIGQAAQGWKQPPALRSAVVRSALAARPGVGGLTIETVAGALVARLIADSDSSVRAAICETLGRLPYASGEQVRRAEAALLETARPDSVIDRLGIAKGLEALIRLSRTLNPPSPAAIAKLRDLASVAGRVRPTADATARPTVTDPSRDARVRRLALEALITAGAADEDVIDGAAADPDAQVRRLAMRAASVPGHAASAADVLQKGLADESAMVRFEALRSAGSPRGESPSQACAASLAATSDRDTHVALLALDQLGRCGASPEAASRLERTVNDLSQIGSPRRWHRSAHALVALASAVPDRAAALLPQFAESRTWQLRLYAARAASVLKERRTLEKLADDEDDNVREASIEGLMNVAGHAADAVYVSELGRPGYQVIRAAASALVGTPDPDAAVPALETTLQRLMKEGRDNSRDAQAEITATLVSLGKPVKPPIATGDLPVTSQLNTEDLSRLASARARVTIRDVGSFELALIASEAPASVVRFARLAESGYYDGLTFHRVVSNFVIQGGSPGANEYIGEASFMRDEVGLWPHVRGAVGISTRGRDTGDAQIFVDLVDNPRLDHEFTVFAQLLNGMDVVDAILEGDVIDRIQIVLGP